MENILIKLYVFLIIAFTSLSVMGQSSDIRAIEDQFHRELSKDGYVQVYPTSYQRMNDKKNRPINSDDQWVQFELDFKWQYRIAVIMDSGFKDKTFCILDPLIMVFGSYCTNKEDSLPNFSKVSILGGKEVYAQFKPYIPERYVVSLAQEQCPSGKCHFAVLVYGKAK